MTEQHSPKAPAVASNGRRTLLIAQSFATTEPNRESEWADGARVGHRDLVALYARRLALLSTSQDPQSQLRYQARVLTKWTTIEPVQFGKTSAERARPAVEPEALAPVAASTPAYILPRRHRQFRFPARVYRLVTAAFIATLLLGGAFGQSLAQQRYRVRDGDTLASIAAEFNVDPDAILRSSWMANPPNPAAGDVLVIPDPEQSPSDAADEAAQLEGTSPWVSEAYYVEAGDSIEAVANAYGVDPDALLSINNLTWASELEVGQRILIPASREAVSGEDITNDAAGGESATNSTLADDTAASESTTNSTVADDSAAAVENGANIWVPAYVQQRNLSCEYASTYIATAAFGDGIPEWAFWDSIPETLNPHYGYRGNIDGWWGNYDDYGIYPEPLVPILNNYGFNGDVFYSEGDTSQLTAELDAGHPVIVWLALWGDTGVVYADEGTYRVFAGEHVMTAYGYDNNGVSLSDPATGGYVFYDWGTFISMWSTSDGMSLAVYPA
ncbi:MAG: LysM peptidoglycan-binding domain-containing protein [Thermomicrobiales bacterium]